MKILQIQTLVKHQRSFRPLRLQQRLKLIRQHKQGKIRSRHRKVRISRKTLNPAVKQLTNPHR